jgi:hypothetical protein
VVGGEDTRVLPRGIPEITITRETGAGNPPKARRMVIWADIASRAKFGGHNNSLANLVRAIDERVFHVKHGDKLVKTPQPRPGAWSKFSGYPQHFARELAGARRLTGDEFLSQCPSSKRKLYARALEEWRALGCSPRHAWLKPFVKFEKLNFDKKPDPAPRVIQPRTPVYNVALGTFIRATAAKMCHAIDSLFNDHPVVMKGKTPAEVGNLIWEKWNAQPDVVGVLLDASRFDQHVSKEALAFEHKCWRAPFRGSGDEPELKWLLKQQLSNKAKTRVEGHVVEYQTDGTRASGDMNTGEGNCILMCTMIHRYCVELGLGWFDLANNGDDCVLFLRRSDLKTVLSTFQGWFLDLGFEMELETTEQCLDGVARVMEHIRFCQASPVRCADGWVMVREPLVGCAKDAMCLGTDDDLSHRHWVHAVGLCGLSLYADIPIYRGTYSRMVEVGLPSNVKNSRLMGDMGLMRAGLKPRFKDGLSVSITDETRVSFAIAFGIVPSRQLEIEGELKTVELGSLDRVPVVWNPSTAFGRVAWS